MTGVAGSQRRRWKTNSTFKGFWSLLFVLNGIGRGGEGRGYDSELPVKSHVVGGFGMMRRSDSTHPLINKTLY